VHCTNEPNVSIPQLANLLIERSQHGNWVVVYKALVTCHHMMCYGNEVSVQSSIKRMAGGCDRDPFRRVCRIFFLERPPNIR